MNHLMLNHLSYKAKPIHQMSSLARALRLSELSLLSLAHKANTMYRIAKEVEKGDGTVRRTFDAHRPLKDIHRRIKLEILDKVVGSRSVGLRVLIVLHLPYRLQPYFLYRRIPSRWHGRGC